MINAKISKNVACVDTRLCVACGCCALVCPRQAIRVWKGIYAKVDQENCVACGKCVKACPASIIRLEGIEHA